MGESTPALAVSRKCGAPVSENLEVAAEVLTCLLLRVLAKQVAGHTLNTPGTHVHTPLSLV